VINMLKREIKKKNAMFQVTELHLKKGREWSVHPIVRKGKGNWSTGVRGKREARLDAYESP